MVDLVETGNGRGNGLRKRDKRKIDTSKPGPKAVQARETTAEYMARLEHERKRYSMRMRT